MSWMQLLLVVPLPQMKCWDQSKSSKYVVQLDGSNKQVPIRQQQTGMEWRVSILTEGSRVAPVDRLFLNYFSNVGLIISICQPPAIASILLPNDAKVAGLSLESAGVLIVRLRILRPPTAPQPPGNGWRLGFAFSVVGLLIVLLSAEHYFSIRNDIESDTYSPPDCWVILSSIAVLLLGLGVIYYVFSAPLDSFNSIILE